MTIQADVVSVLEAAGLRVNADYEPQSAVGDFVVVVRSAKEPTMTLLGSAGWPTKSTFSLICKSDGKAGAALLAASVMTAIQSSTTIATKFFEPVDEAEFDAETMDNAEVVNLSIWH